MACIYHHSILQSSFTALKNPLYCVLISSTSSPYNENQRNRGLRGSLFSEMAHLCMRHGARVSGGLSWGDNWVTKDSPYKQTTVALSGFVCLSHSAMAFRGSDKGPRHCYHTYSSTADPVLLGHVEGQLQDRTFTPSPSTHGTDNLHMYNIHP